MKRFATSARSLFLALAFAVALPCSVAAQAQVEGCSLGGSAGGSQGGFNYVLVAYDDNYCYYEFTCNSGGNCNRDIHMWEFEIEGVDY